MIRLPESLQRLTPVERFGLGVLIDSSRLLPVDDPSAAVVRLSLAGAPADVPEGHSSQAVVQDGEVVLQRSRLSLLAGLAGGVAEQRSTAGDKYGRVPAAENPAVRLNSVREPAVSREGAALRKAVEQAAGRRPVRCVSPWPDGRRWAAALTHDLDLVSGWPWYTLMRVGELLSRGRALQAAEVLANGLAWLARDPVWRGVSEILDLERTAGISATWFVICGTPTLATMRAGDITYDPDAPAVRRILEAVAAGGHEIGLHGSFETMVSAERLRKQRDRLAGLTGKPVTGVRQHFLRMRPGATQRAMLSAGFSYDATWGFSDRNGFRLSVADVLPGWDAEQGSLSGVDEVPLMWMDRALSKYAGLEDPERWVDDALQLARVCRDVNGVWVGLWHPNLTSALGFPGAPAAFRRLLEVLLAGLPYVDRLDRIVAWRAARRGLRASAIAADGRLQLAADRAWSGAAVLEDPTGGPAISQPWPEPSRG